MKECYYVYYKLKFDDGKDYTLNLSYAYEEDPKDVVIHFDSFDEMVEWIGESKGSGILIGYTLFRKKKYIAWGWDSSMNEKTFSPCSVIEEYKIFYPSVSEAMKLLTVEQFREYWENRGEKKCPKD